MPVNRTRPTTDLEAYKIMNRKPLKSEAFVDQPAKSTPKEEPWGYFDTEHGRFYPGDEVWVKSRNQFVRIVGILKSENQFSAHLSNGSLHCFYQNEARKTVVVDCPVCGQEFLFGSSHNCPAADLPGPASKDLPVPNFETKHGKFFQGDKIMLGGIAATIEEISRYDDKFLARYQDGGAVYVIHVDKEKARKLHDTEIFAAKEPANSKTKHQYPDQWRECKVSAILAEYQRAVQKFPPFHSGHEGWAMIAEEMYELWRVVCENQSTPGRAERMEKEAVQVAAMALRFLTDLPGFKN